MNGILKRNFEDNKQERKRSVIAHISCWILYYGGIMLIVYLNSPKFNFWSLFLTYTISISTFYYLSYFLLPKFYNSKQYHLLIFWGILFWLTYIAMNIFVAYFFDKKVYGKDPPQLSFESYFLPISMYFLQILVLATVLYQKRKALANEKLLRARQSEVYAIEKRQLEVEFENKQILSERKRVELQNALLRAKLNPHFLQNTLNYFFTTAYTLDAHLAKLLEMFGAVMAYSCRQPDPWDMKTDLTSESEQIKRLIALLQARYYNELHLQYQITGELLGVRIIPNLLVSIAENAFKHGVLNDADHPVSISLTVIKGRLSFITHNKKRNGPKELSDGIGNITIRELLELEYPGSYNYEVDDKGEFYKTTLTINF
jgi:two-component system, LytTR family, sensor kinase